MESRSTLLHGISLSLLAYLFIALSSACVQALPESFPTMEIVFFQNLVCLLVIIPYCYKKGTLNFQKNNLSLHLIRDFAGIFSFLTLFYAIQTLGLVNAMTIAYMYPFYVPFVCKIWSKDPIEKDVWWTVVIGFIGILVILKPGNLFHVGAWVAILSAILSAFAVVALKNLNLKGESLSRTLFYFFTTGTIFSFLLCLHDWQNPSFGQLFLLLGIGGLSIIAQIFLTKAYQHGTAAFLSPLSYATIIFSTILGWIFFHQAQHWSIWLGVLIVIVGGMLSFFLRLRPKTLASAFERQNHVKKSFFFWKKTPKE